jgi:hypothetical protein
MNEHALRSVLEDIISVYKWCSVDPADRGYSALDAEISRAEHLLAAGPTSTGSPAHRANSPTD